MVASDASSCAPEFILYDVHDVDAGSIFRAHAFLANGRDETRGSAAAREKEKLSRNLIS